VGLDGEKKMSKSLDNYVGVTEDPVQSFGKLMSIPDAAIETYLRLVTDMPDADIDAQLARMQSGALNPRDLKDRMAWEIVCDLHGREAADNARSEFARVFRAHELPEEMTDVSVTTPAPIYAWIVAAGMAGSNNEARRLVAQGGVRLNGERIEDADRSIALAETAVLQVGRRRFARLHPHGI
jgi:tyrosyl-tRNA synthetase